MARKHFDHLLLSDKMIFTFLKEMKRDPSTSHLFKKPLIKWKYPTSGTVARELYLYANDYYKKHYNGAWFRVGRKRVSRIFNKYFKDKGEIKWSTK